MFKTQKSGFTVIEVILLVALVVVGAFAWIQYQNNQKEAPQTNDNRSAPAQQEEPAQKEENKPQTYESEWFSVEPPQAWSFSEVDGSLSSGMNETHTFTNDNNDYVSVYFEQGGRGVNSDLGWRYEATEDGTVSLTATPRELCVEGEPFCDTGNGELLIVVGSSNTITVQADDGAASIIFFAGNRSTEDVSQADLSGIKQLINSIEIK